MITKNVENVSTLKINKLTQAQYDRENAAGNVVENEIYLTPEDTIDVERVAFIDVEDNQNITEPTSPITLGLHTDGLLYIFIEGKPIGSGVALSSGVSGDVFGYVDESNNIIVQGNLADGTYNIKYEMEDENGNVVTIDIGNLVLDTAVVKVINQIPISIDTDKEPFVGTNGEKGYKTGYRLSLSGGGESEQVGTEVTGFIPVTKDSTIRIKNIAYAGDTTRGVVGYDSNFTKLSTGNGMPINTMFVDNGFDDGNGVRRSNVLKYYTHFNSDNLAYIRLCSTDINENSIITVDQEIV